MNAVKSNVRHSSQAVQRPIEAANELRGVHKTETKAMNKPKPMSRAKCIVLAAAATVAGLMGAASSARATTVTLQNGDATALINPNHTATPDNPGNVDGMYNWTVDGTKDLGQQWFWYRIGNTGPDKSINSLISPTTPVSLSTQSTTGDGKNNFASMTYTSATSPLKINVSYLLTGGSAGSGTADIGETIRITNTGKTAMSFHFFQYSDFNLSGNGAGTNDTLSITGGNTATQTAGNISATTVISPRSTLFQAGSGSAILTSLNDGNPTTLNDVSGVSNTNADWAFEWDVNIAAGGSFLISADKRIVTVPEPGAGAAALGLAGMFLMRPRRRDEDSDPRDSNTVAKG